MEAGMKDQALFETAPAQPMLMADEPARELLAAEVAIGGICGVY
jgi:mycofactocin precursor